MHSRRPLRPRAGLCPLRLHRAEPGPLRLSTGRTTSPQVSQGQAESLQLECGFAGSENQQKAGKDGGGWGKGRHQRVGAGWLGRVKELGCWEKLIDRVSWWQQQGLPGPRSFQLAPPALGSAGFT